MPASPSRRLTHAPWHRQLLRLVALTLLAFAALQAYFLMRVVGLALINPASTAVQRSEAWRLLQREGQAPWAQGWVNSERISVHLKRAVIASEDSRFVHHAGFEWEALERAFDRHKKQATQTSAAQGTAASSAKPKAWAGGSTISQQLAKNLFLSGERNVLRKGQEMVITKVMEWVLTKSRILEIYLNHVEWGEGLFGAQMAARFYQGVDASKLTPPQAARLAVMLPAPKRFEQSTQSSYLQERAAQIEARMRWVSLP